MLALSNDLVSHLPLLCLPSFYFGTPTLCSISGRAQLNLTTLAEHSNHYAQKQTGSALTDLHLLRSGHYATLPAPRPRRDLGL